MIVGEALVAIRPETEGFQNATESKLKGILGILPGPIAAIGGVGVAVAGTLFAIGTKFEDSFNRIAIGTGATGKQLAGLDVSFKRVLSGTASSFKDVSAAIVGVAQKTGLTGPPLEALAKRYANLARITKTDVTADINATIPVFNSFGIAAKDQSAALNTLFKASQASGVGVDALGKSLTRTSTVLTPMGLSFAQQTALVAAFGREGIRSQSVIMGLGQQFALAAKKGKDPIATIDALVASLKNARTPADALAIATKALGSRAGMELAKAVRLGTFNVDAFAKTLADGKGGINATAEATMTLGDKFKHFKNVALVALEPIAMKVLDLVTKGIDFVVARLPAMEAAFGRVTAVIRPMLAAILPVFDSLAGAVKGLIAGHLKEWLGALVGVLAALLVPLAAYAASMAAAAAATLVAAAPFIAVGAALAGIGYAVVLAYDRIKPFRDAIAHIREALVHLMPSVEKFGQLLLRQLLVAFRLLEPLLVKLVIDVWPKLRLGFEKILPVLKIIGEVVGGVILLALSRVIPIVSALADVLVSVLDPALSLVGDVFNVIGDLLSGHFMAALGDLGNIFGDIGNIIGAVFGGIPTLLGGIFGSLGSIILDAMTSGLGDLASMLLGAGRSVIDGLWNGIKAGWTAGLTFLTHLPALALTALGKVGTWLLDAGGKVIRGLYDGILGTWTTEIKGMLKIGTWILTALGDVGKWLLDTGGKVIRGLYDGIHIVWTTEIRGLLNIGEWLVSALGDAGKWLLAIGGRTIHGLYDGIHVTWLNTVRGLLDIRGWVLGVIGDASQWLLNVGKAIVDGLVKGITNGASDVGKAIAGLGGGLVGKAEGVLGIHSPSSVFADIGHNIMAGLAAGLDGSSHLPEKAMANLALVVPPPHAAAAIDAMRGATASTTRGRGGSTLGGGSSTNPQLAEIIDLLRRREPLALHQTIHGKDPVTTAAQSVSQLRAAQFRAAR